MGAVSCLPDQAIVEGALSVVWKLASGCPANCVLFEQLEEAGRGEDDVDGVSELIVMAMGVHSEDEATLQEQACLAVAALAEASVRTASAHAHAQHTGMRGHTFAQAPRRNLCRQLSREHLARLLICF